MATFVDFIQNLDRWGVTDVILPFLLIFTLVYAMLRKIKIFGDDKKAINMTIAFVMALTVVVLHVTNSYPPNRDVVDIINIALPNLLLVAVAVFLFLLIVGLFKVEAVKMADTGYSLITLILINIWVKSAFDEISFFILFVSILLIAITLVVGEGQAFFGRIPIIFGLTVVMIFHYAVGWDHGLPRYLYFLNNIAFQTFVIAVLVFFFFISLVTTEKTSTTAPVEKAFKMFK